MQNKDKHGFENSRHNAFLGLLENCVKGFRFVDLVVG
jgi:hypothetical protein